MKLLQINSVVNSGSHGRIAEDIGRVALSHGHESYIAYGRGNRPSSSNLIRIGSQVDVYMHGLKSLLFDRHGFGSFTSTKELVKQISLIDPDIIHLHNVHGYYLNIEVLFDYLSESEKPVVWTFHDCWAFTGHCAHFEYDGCFKWKAQCHNCPKLRFYPKSLLLDNSRNNYKDKKRLFNKLKNLKIIAPCRWLEAHVGDSFLKDYQTTTIHNGVDISTFKPDINLKTAPKQSAIFQNPYIIGVANIWSARKGFSDFIKLREHIDESIKIILVGLNNRQLNALPANIVGFQRTESVHELAKLYANALCYVNPTYQDNFPTTNIEALACGTPVVTYNTGGSPEAIDEHTGRVVSKGDIHELARAIKTVCSLDRDQWRINCRKRAEEHFDKDKQYREYLKIYEQLINRAAINV